MRKNVTRILDTSYETYFWYARAGFH